MPMTRLESATSRHVLGHGAANHGIVLSPRSIKLQSTRPPHTTSFTCVGPFASFNRFFSVVTYRARLREL